MNATDDQTRTDRARRDKRSWGIPRRVCRIAAKQANEWHRWYAPTRARAVDWGCEIGAYNRRRNQCPKESVNV